MASTYNELGIELMATGENAGTWGTKTNTNLDIIQQAIAGYVAQAVTDGGTTALTITDGSTSTSIARNIVIKLTGALTGTSIVTVPDSIEKLYVVNNATTGGQTVTFKTASGTGVNFTTTGYKFLYSDGTNIVEIGLTTSPAGTVGQVQYNNSGVFGAISEGTTGQILTSTGSGSAPTFQDNNGVSTGKAIAMAIVFG